MGRACFFGWCFWCCGAGLCEPALAAARPLRGGRGPGSCCGWCSWRRSRPACRTPATRRCPGPRGPSRATAICCEREAWPRGRGVLAAAVGLPGALAELQPTGIAVAGVDRPVAAGLHWAIASQLTESACAGATASSGVTAATPAAAAAVTARRRSFERGRGRTVAPGGASAHWVPPRLRSQLSGSGEVARPRIWRLHPEAHVAPRNGGSPAPAWWSRPGRRRQDSAFRPGCPWEGRGRP